MKSFILNTLAFTAIIIGAVAIMIWPLLALLGGAVVIIKSY